MTEDSTRAQDPPVDQDEADRRRSAAARTFDIRRVIGGLFVAYGLIVGGIGLFDDQAAIDKAQGVRINLWSGLAMLAFGLLFLLWQWLRPVSAPVDGGDGGDEEQPEHAGGRSG